MTVDTTDVTRVLGATDLADPQLTAFIEAAGRLYDDRIEGLDVDADRRDDVVAHLAAHLIATGPERQVSSGGEGGGSISFEGETAEGLSATTHGQVAVTLDPTGKLASSDKPAATLSAPDVKRNDYR